jgi:hypothetical protein
MPDEFPTLEAVAALATLAALLRTVQVFGALGEVRRSSVEIAEALGRGDRAEARRVCERSEGRAFARLATVLLDTLDARPVDVEELTRTVEHAALRVRRRSRRASASGALVGILLVGLLFYAVVSRLSPKGPAAPSTLFDLLVVLGVVVLAIGIVANQRLASETRLAARRMVSAATGAQGTA